MRNRFLKNREFVLIVFFLLPSPLLKRGEPADETVNCYGGLKILQVYKADQTAKSLVVVRIKMPSISDRQILPSMSDSFYSFGRILPKILSFLYRHLLTFYIEAGLVCKRTISLNGKRK